MKAFNRISDVLFAPITQKGEFSRYAGSAGTSQVPLGFALLPCGSAARQFSQVLDDHFQGSLALHIQVSSWERLPCGSWGPLSTAKAHRLTHPATT